MDKDAMYINIPDAHVRFTNLDGTLEQQTQGPAEKPDGDEAPEDREGLDMVKSLQRTQMAIDERLEESGFQMFKGSSGPTDTRKRRPAPEFTGENGEAAAAGGSDEDVGDEGDAELEEGSDEEAGNGFVVGGEGTGGFAGNAFAQKLMQRKRGDVVESTDGARVAEFESDEDSDGARARRDACHVSAQRTCRHEDDNMSIHSMRLDCGCPAAACLPW
jgi:hypothetical protein